MKTLNLLIKIHKDNVTSLNFQIEKLKVKQQEILNDISLLEKKILEETKNSELLYFDKYLMMVNDLISIKKDEYQNIVNKIEVLLEKMRQEFFEEKKFRIIRDQKIQIQKKYQLQKENQMLDELAQRINKLT